MKNKTYCSNYRCLLREKCSRSTKHLVEIPIGSTTTEFQFIDPMNCNFFEPLVREGTTNQEGFPLNS